MNRFGLITMLVGLSACQPTPPVVPSTPINTGQTAEQGVDPASEKVNSDIKGLDSEQEALVKRAMGIDDALKVVAGTMIEVPDFAAEGALAWSWKDEKGEVSKLVVESKGETYDGVDSVYFEAGQPIFARRFHFANPAKFDVAGSETYDDALAARSAESTLFFFDHGKVAAVSSTGVQLAKQDAELDADNRLVEWPITVVKALDPAGEEFSAAVASINETLGVVFN